MKKTTLRILAVALIAGGTMFAQARLSIGVRVGGYGPGYYPPPAYAQYAPPCPGPGYTWTDGYWQPEDGRNVWIAGFWQAPYNSGYGYGYSVAPRYVAPRYYNSYRSYDRYDRDDHDRNRGYENRYQNRGGERHDNRGDNHGNQRNDNRRYDNRGNGYSNGFRR